MYILGVFIYLLKARLKISFRIQQGLQTLSLLLYSKLIYLDFEDQKFLEIFGQINGPYLLDYRIQ